MDRNFDVSLNYKEVLLSLSVRRAWIEILVGCPQGRWQPVALRKESVDRNDVLAISAVLELVSLSVRRAWIEITYVIRLPRVQVSLSVRRAWIEILVAITPSNFSNVALRKESVDRNLLGRFWCLFGLVALRKESVDRNADEMSSKEIFRVALRKESVDRNSIRPFATDSFFSRSP